MIIDGKKVALELREKIKARLAQHPHLKITLITVSVGDDPASRVYVGMQHRTAEAAGLYPEHIQLAADTSQEQLEEQIEHLAQDDKVNGIILQLPLPGHLDKDAALAKIPPKKDIDGQTDVNMGRLLQGRKQLVPCTPLGVMRLIEAYNIETSGKTAVVVGRSAVVGLPQFLLLAGKGVDATVTVAHSRTTDLAGLCRSADILVSAIGSPALITEEYIKPGAMVFDVGVSETPSGIRGDVDFDAVCKIAGGVTPMPGGTGPMTVACLLENTLLAAQLQNALPG
jgi:methylenetetrahydrofolate dehydrogenase (NADP+)/methenyltetrahydrofolate cyclohydrolase